MSRRWVVVAIATLGILTTALLACWRFIVRHFLSGPAIAVSERIVDFGEITIRAKHGRDVVVSNVGRGELIISRVAIGCGCLSVKLTPSNRIAPGGSALIQFEIEIAKETGPIGRLVDVFVFSNDQANTPLKLVVRAASNDVAAAFSPILDFGTVERKELPKRIPLAMDFRELGRDVGLATAGYWPPYIRVSVAGNMQSAEHCDIVLSKGAPLGSIYENIRVSSEAKATSKVVEVRGFIAGPVIASPRFLVVGPVESGAPVLHETITLFSAESPNGKIRIDQDHTVCIVSEELQGFVSCQQVGSDGHAVFRVVVDPSRMSGAISPRKVFGHIRFRLVSIQGLAESLVVPLLIDVVENRHFD